MNLVAINNTTNNVLESQVFTNNKELIQGIITKNLASSGLATSQYGFEEMTDEQLQQYILEH